MTWSIPGRCCYVPDVARSASGESVLTRAVRIFEAFTPDETVLSVTQIARRARLHPATASRLVAELEARVRSLLRRDRRAWQDNR